MQDTQSVPGPWRIEFDEDCHVVRNVETGAVALEFDQEAAEDADTALILMAMLNDLEAA